MLGDDLSYLLEVLNIRDGDSEDQFDERLKLEAKELGLDVNEGQTDTRSVHSEYSRRSESLDSRASYSTGLTSHFSELSRGDLPSRQGRLSHPLSFRDYDAFLARGIPNGRHSVSFSPSATPESSVFSLPLSHPVSSSPMRHFRRIRDRLQQRNDSHTSLVDGCPHCPQDVPSQRRAVHTLPCGHRLCTKALRNTTKSATESNRGSVPSCCSKPIPGSLVEQVMTQEEQNALLEKLEQWDEAAPSIESSRRGSTATQNFPTVLSDRSEQTSSEFERQKEFSTTAHDELERITELPEYTTLLSIQVTQRDRFLHWTAGQRASLAASHSDQRKNILTTHESVAEDLAEHHADALAEAEDKQIVAEAALREVHLIEKFSAETCLRHREAYCSGMLSNGEAHGRNITDINLERLESARREKEMIQGRHFSAINVLRGEQGRRIKLRKQRQERELQELARQQRREELEFERRCSAEVSKLEGGLSEKKRKLEWRWELQMALLAKKLWQHDGEMEENFRLPTAKWTGSEPDRLVSASAELIADTAVEMESQVPAQEFKVG